MPKIKSTTDFVYSKEEIEALLISNAAFLTGNRKNENCKGKVNWKIRKGDVGIKDPMDYSEYQPTEVTSVTVTI